MKVGILGTRGIPNNYGGFEQCAQYLSKGLVEHGFDVTVYNSHRHPYQKSTWEGVNIVHCFDPEYRLGTVGQFIYDLNCIIDSRKRRFDIILQLGYTSNSIWGPFLSRKNCIITTNMDGLEWARTKYSPMAQRFLRFAEKLAVKYSDYLISDSKGIQTYLLKKYKVQSDFIPYGAQIFNSNDPTTLKRFSVDAFAYNMLIARMEPENSIEEILDGAAQDSSQTPFLVIGGYENKFAQYLKEKYSAFSHIRFLGSIYDIEVLNNLRYYSKLYFHGHTVGGTNPSLLEAMASSAIICAHNNVFNRSILGDDGYYFKSEEDVKIMLENASSGFKALSNNQDKLNKNLKKIRVQFSWEAVINEYIKHFRSIKYDDSLLAEQSVLVPMHFK